MESMQASQNEMRSMLASLVGKAGDKGAAPEAQDQALAQKLPEACAGAGLSGETGAVVAAGWDKSNAERDVLATLTQRITALESASQRLAATENGLADLKWLCTRKDGMGLVPRLEMAHALESAQACLPKRGVQPAITDRQQQFYTEIKAKAISAEVLDKVLVEVEPVVESALEGTREAWQHAEKISNDVQDLQHSVKQADKKG
ncbi:hypothetical protein DUNSADRAFT_10725 [Dunaliella salina]|uniref:Uncharacterized protein n=1 Tax=Dunaliella salina TaxID=3046 RepID=A0ABQ7GEM7_DUNSA|nr:hypothetical protein DUNSADRAFT_10725 [Dunaliella salina]|eukprot:KAF5833061.1 hypothetical protein DUNSADRAFT_10725 [Dunaliella salina]